MKKIATALLVTAICIAASAQHDTQPTLNHFAVAAFNPAANGEAAAPELTALLRKQWTGIKRSPALGVVHLATGHAEKKLRMGALLNSYSAGIANRIALAVDASYNVKLSTAQIFLGLRLGMESHSFRYSDVLTAEANDQQFATDVYGLLAPNAGAGIFVRNNSVRFGYSLPRLFHNALSSNQTSVNMKTRFDTQHLQHHLFAAYTVTQGARWRLEPMVMLRATPKQTLWLQTTLAATYSERLSAGIAWRNADAVAFFMGMEIVSGMTFTYGYDLGISPLRNSHSGSHEVALRFSLKKNTADKSEPANKTKEE